jgi:hypothetical protein
MIISSLALNGFPFLFLSHVKLNFRQSPSFLNQVRSTCAQGTIGSAFDGALVGLMLGGLAGAFIPVAAALTGFPIPDRSLSSPLL